MSASPPGINVPLDAEPEQAYDPLRLCVFTTVAILAWVLSPPIAVMAFSAVGLWGYFRARRAGLLRSRCLLGDTRLVMVYLGLAFAAAAFFAIRNLSDWLA